MKSKMGKAWRLDVSNEFLEQVMFFDRVSGKNAQITCLLSQSEANIQLMADQASDYKVQVQEHVPSINKLTVE